MQKGILFGGAFLVTLAATSAFAGERIQVGQCSPGFVVYHAGPVMRSANKGSSGLPMREGYIAVSDRNALPFNTYVKLPEVYGDRIFRVEDDGKDPAGRKVVVIWHDNFGLAGNFDNPPVTKVCVVDPTPDQLAANKLN